MFQRRVGRNAKTVPVAGAFQAASGRGARQTALESVFTPGTM
jgi:hypothetical protein